MPKTNTIREVNWSDLAKNDPDPFTIRMSLNLPLAPFLTCCNYKILQKYLKRKTLCLDQVWLNGLHLCERQPKLSLYIKIHVRPGSEKICPIRVRQKALGLVCFAISRYYSE